MSEEKPSLVDVLFERRRFVLAMLMVPVLGMAIAVVMILLKRPDNMVVVLGVILFVAVQYILMMFFWFKRLESMVAKKEQGNPKPSEQSHREVEEFTPPVDVLAPEEERVFPVKEE